MSAIDTIDWGRIALNAAYVAGLTFFSLWYSQEAIACLKPTAIAFGATFVAGFGLELKTKGLLDEPPKKGGSLEAATKAVLFIA